MESNKHNGKAIVISDLKKIYGSNIALNGINLIVKEGEFFGLLGPNGAGKTTAINIITGLCNKLSGSVEIFGHDNVKEYIEARKLIGLVPQEFNFDQFLPLEKMLLFQAGYYGIPLETAKKRVQELLKLLDLLDKKDAVLRTLSGGMKRRAMIARALVHDPKIIILDEPTAGVDVELRKITWKLLRELNKQGKTIILTTHYIEEAEFLCERIAIIKKGQIILCDKTQNLLKKLDHQFIKVELEKPISDNQMKKLEKYNPKRINDGNIIEIEYRKTANDYNEILKDLINAGVDIGNISPSENRLENVFINLTKEDEK